MRRNGFVLVLAVVVGLVAAYLARDWIQRQAVAIPAPTNTILAAAVPLGFGTELTADNIVEIPWAAAQLPEGAFATKNDVLKDGRRVTLSPMQRGEPILRGKVTGPGQRASLSTLLGEGNKAVTVRVDDVRGVAGFVLPGDRVDVVLIRDDRQVSGSQVSDILIQHAKVLAVDQLANERREQPTVAKAVTLEVTTDQAQKILLASNVGRLALILRQAGQNHPEQPRRITEADLSQASIESPSPKKADKPLAAPSLPRTTTVDIVRGTKRSQYSVHRTEK